MSEHTYEIHLWDTFEPRGRDTIHLKTKDALNDAVLWAAQRYVFDRRGADRVEIVERPSADIVFSFKISGASRQPDTPEAVNADLLEALEQVWKIAARAQRGGAGSAIVAIEPLARAAIEKAKPSAG